MIASAEATDHYLDEQEIVFIKNKAERLVSTLAEKGMSYTEEDIEKKLNQTFNRYLAIGDAAPQGQMDQKIMDEFHRAANYLKDQAWFNARFARSLILDLIAIAEADGEVIKNEEHYINKIAQLWGVEVPFK